MIVRGFIDSFESLLTASKEEAFTDEVNPIDGVVYPLICTAIPEPVKAEIEEKLTAIKGAPIDINTMFMRRSPKGVSCPHEVHSDISMGKYSLMLYINGGHTSLVRHKASGIAYSPEDIAYLDIIHQDQNKEDAWLVTELMGGEPNMAAIFDASRLHRAEPIGGFGSGADSRVVLTCFFS